ncbi:hypothetical protein C8F04DRAFT_91676 [Mycena alexandri]|uniref:Ig-like domain-containing protein n=1 Tax=Mycena alexandri TaxID=1745969 RepID=A0AAD6SHM6_9AGAR|nr:hypothetical protein C8F04DRAFT_91676 [Mycena alexandri]
MKLWAPVVWIWIRVVQGHFATRPAVTESRRSSTLGPDSFTFDQIDNMTTCTPALITWTYSGSITDSLALTIRASISLALAQPIAVVDPVLQIYGWSSPNVSEGWYTLGGTVAGLNDQSSQFYVNDGTDISCLATHPSLSSSAAASRTTTPSGAATSGSSNIGIAQTPLRNIGGIIGGITGGLAFTVLIVVLRHQYTRRSGLKKPIQPPSSPQPAAGSMSTRDGVTVLALDRPIAPAVVESQEAMFDKFAQMREGMRRVERGESSGGREHGAERDEGDARSQGASAGLPAPSVEPTEDAVATPQINNAPGNEMPNINHGVHLDAPDIVEQMRTMAERLALLEARTRSNGLSEEGPPEYSD